MNNDDHWIVNSSKALKQLFVLLLVWSHSNVRSKILPLCQSLNYFLKYTHIFSLSLIFIEIKHQFLLLCLQLICSLCFCFYLSFPPPPNWHLIHSHIYKLHRESSLWSPPHHPVEDISLIISEFSNWNSPIAYIFPLSSIL